MTTPCICNPYFYLTVPNLQYFQCFQVTHTPVATAMAHLCDYLMRLQPVKAHLCDHPMRLQPVFLSHSAQKPNNFKAFQVIHTSVATAMAHLSNYLMRLQPVFSKCFHFCYLKHHIFIISALISDIFRLFCYHLPQFPPLTPLCSPKMKVADARGSKSHKQNTVKRQIIPPWGDMS